jgi:hypothetical protein
MEHFVDLIKSVREYFNDFVGAVIPGAVLCAGLTLQWAQIVRDDAFSRYWGEWSWLPGLAVIFAAGHTLLSLHAFFISSISRDRARHKVVAKASTAEYQRFLGTRSPGITWAITDFNAARNFAMSVSPEAAEIGRRFMFLSLFCYGTATSFAVLCCSALVSPTLGYGTWNALRVTIALILAGSALLLDNRGLKFEVQALGTPLAIACAELRQLDKTPVVTP